MKFKRGEHNLGGQRTLWHPPGYTCLMRAETQVQRSVGSGNKQTDRKTLPNALPFPANAIGNLT